MSNLPEIIAALSFFGAVVVCPLVYLLMRHQRTIAEIAHRNGSYEVQQKLEQLNQEVRMLKSAHHARILEEDDRGGLSRRASST